MDQIDMFETQVARSLLDDLIANSRLYTHSQDYKELLEFVVRLRNFAPFNAMLLQLQKPGMRYAASAYDWRERFGRFPRDRARPLLILWPFGPVALVYDVADTEGRELPADVASFFARGAVDEKRLVGFIPLLSAKSIQWSLFDGGDQAAGSICVLRRPTNEGEACLYSIEVNRNHTAPTRFVTLVHELAHLFLGHLGPDRKLNIPERPTQSHSQRELEAESAAYLVCARNGIRSKSETYLASYVKDHTTIDDIDLYQIMRAAGQIETLLALSAHTRYAPLGKAK